MKVTQWANRNIRASCLSVEQDTLVTHDVSVQLRVFDPHANNNECHDQSGAIRFSSKTNNGPGIDNSSMYHYCYALLLSMVQAICFLFCFNSCGHVLFT